jgi:hypothetical protein
LLQYTSVLIDWSSSWRKGSFTFFGSKPDKMEDTKPELTSTLASWVESHPVQPYCKYITVARARDLRWHGDILTCFVVFGGTVISGGMEGSVHLWLYNHEEAVFTYRKVCHQKPLGHQASVTDMHMCTLLMHRMAHESPRSTSTPAAPSLAIAIMQEY